MRKYPYFATLQRRKGTLIAMKIFPKTFLYTLALLVLIAGLANLLVYTLMPAVYTNQKQANLTAHADQLAQQLGNAAREDIVELMG